MPTTKTTKSFGLEGQAGVAARDVIRSGRHDRTYSSWRLRLGAIAAELAAEPPASSDVVFWDPFSPRHDSALWSVSAFSALRRVCRAGATVHTYSGATATRSALLLAGFAVGFGPSASDKQKHTTIAALKVEDLERPLDRVWFDRLTRSAACWPPDAPADALARLASLSQFASR